MDNLKVGQVSGLVQSGFGWHLIQVIEKRNADVTVEQKRQRARLAIRAVKSEEAFQDWQRQLRDRAFIEYHNGTK
jgi:peptidyl-prolyl cis-trans isomerase SurA